jgi:hypothetical protein
MDAALNLLTIPKQLEKTAVGTALSGFNGHGTALANQRADALGVS